MSRMTASPFYKPAPFTFPREPISPPETLPADSMYPAATVLPPTNVEHRDRDEEHMPNHTSLPSHPRVGRPSISYQNSGFRDPPNRPVHRSYRFFVVVVPPSRFINEHGQLGHTLASGPPQRLSQGIIMPLYPTMYGQLAAIAKEFNFPSTAGLCLYLQVNENGAVMTPRISDESWHMLWSHLFDTSSVPRGPPIGGRIEFDIDLQQARWYSSWLSTMAREPIDRPVAHIPSYSSSIILPAENRYSVDGDYSRGFDHLESSPPLQPRNTPSRHVPRKLSLVERFDAPAESRTRAAQGLGIPDQGISTNKTLSPIAQEAEPRSARENLDDRVNSWRASAIVKPSPLAGRGQISLEPVNLPNTVSLDGDTPARADAELSLEDFTWSVSSVGPDDYDYDTVSYAPSEHIPSPDIAFRMFDDSPPTPSTATSWGAPLSYPPSPLSDYRPPSLDLAFRTRFSPPMTPVTATSWGPPSPASLTDWYPDAPRPGSIHLGDRGEFSRPVTPSTATTWGAPLFSPPTPTTPFYVQTPDIAHRYIELSGEYEFMQGSSPYPATIGRPWRSVWPYFKPNETQSKDTDTVQPWHFVWPYCKARKAKTEYTDTVRPWRSVWPYFQVDGNQAQSSDSEIKNTTGEMSRYPFFSIYQAVYPHFGLYPEPAASVEQRPQRTTPIKTSLDKHDPSLEIYSPVYPHNLVIYPEIQPSKDFLSRISVSLSQYPKFDLDPPSSNMNEQVPTVPSLRNCLYPGLNIYLAVYPNFDLYPAIQPPTSDLKDNDKGHLASSLGTSYYGEYPNLVIYPSVYPHLEIYTPKAAGMMENQASAIMKPIQVVFSAQYPKFDIYPAVYPNLNLYPVSSASNKMQLLPPPPPPPIVVSKSQYPAFDLYPAVYPHIDIYPSKAGSYSTVPKQAATVIGQPDTYPLIRPYPPVFPYFDLYPPMPVIITTTDTKNSNVLLPGATAYPRLVIYPAVYPHFSLYPPLSGQVSGEPQQISSTLVSHYPFLQIYPYVYPHLSIYPQIAAPTKILRRVAIHGTSSGTTKVHNRATRKSHDDLHQEVFRSGNVHPSDTGMTTHSEIDLRPLNIQARHIQRRIAATRSPTGPAFHRPSTPPALPSPKRKLPTPPPSTNGSSRGPNVGEQITGLRREISPMRGYFPPARSPSRTGVTATQRASMASPFRQMPLSKSGDLLTCTDEVLPATPQTMPSGLNRAKSVNSVRTEGRSSAIKAQLHHPYYRDD